jgi:hypothetical protein
MPLRLVTPPGVACWKRSFARLPRPAGGQHAVANIGIQESNLRQSWTGSVSARETPSRFLGRLAP